MNIKMEQTCRYQLNYVLSENYVLDDADKPRMQRNVNNLRRMEQKVVIFFLVLRNHLPNPVYETNT